MLNFFDEIYQEPPIADTLFGLCDDKHGGVAFIDKTNQHKWAAAVENPHCFTVIFTAIDKGVIKDSEYPDHERCDGMLTTNKHLYFIELKNQKENWIQKGIAQLESTIKLFCFAHSGKKKNYIHKKAYLCNIRHPRFHVSDNEQNLRFFRTYGFRLDIQARVVLA